MYDPKLDTLLMVVKTKNFTKAANELALTQPAVSHHINQLEEGLGVSIFNRYRGQLQLTSEGEIVIMYARRMKALYEKLQENLLDQELERTRLKIGITHTAESNIIAEVLTRYSSANKGFTIKIITESIRKLYTMLMNYELDLAIVEGKVRNSNINSVLLDTDYLVLVTSVDNHLAKRSMVRLNELKQEKMILRLPDSGTSNLFVSHLQSLNMSIDEFNVILEVDNIATIKDLVSRNLGVSILARSACISDVRRGKLKILPIENLSMIREISILYHKDFNHTDILHDITKIYNETAKIYEEK